MKFSCATIFIAIANPALASLFFEDSKSDKIKNNLANIGYEVLDAAGTVKDSVFESFDKDSINDWLAAHNVYDAGNDFLEVAKKHKDWLLEDIQDYVDSGSDEAHKFIGKGKQFYEAKAAQATSAAAAASSSVSESAAHIAKLGQHWFDGWDTEELKKKLAELNQNVAGTRKELTARLYTAYVNSFEDSKKDGEKAAKTLAEKLGEWKEASIETFNSWSVEDLQDYLKEVGTEAAQTKDSLVQSAQTYYSYLVHGKPKPVTFYDRVTQGVKSLGSSFGRLLQGDFSVLHVDL